jgi:hypothetical protein
VSPVGKFRTGWKPVLPTPVSLLTDGYCIVPAEGEGWGAGEGDILGARACNKVRCAHRFATRVFTLDAIGLNDKNRTALQ